MEAGRRAIEWAATTQATRATRMPCRKASRCSIRMSGVSALEVLFFGSCPKRRMPVFCISEKHRRTLSVKVVNCDLDFWNECSERWSLLLATENTTMSTSVPASTKMATAARMELWWENGGNFMKIAVVKYRKQHFYLTMRRLCSRRSSSTGFCSRMLSCLLWQCSTFVWKFNLSLEKSTKEIKNNFFWIQFTNLSLTSFHQEVHFFWSAKGGNAEAQN